MDDAALKITLRCADLEASRQFYGDALGLEVVDEWEEAHGNGCIYAVGAGFVELNETAGGATAGSHGRRFDLQIKVGDLDAWLERLESRWPHEEPKVQPWGERTVRMRDPDGLLVTIYQALR
jgi:catechol 2,3-dioxygenase-like lactoylglutathione lyase family enzyme